MRQVLAYRAWFDQRRGWRFTNPNLEQLGLVRVEYIGLDELCTNDAIFADAPAILAGASAAVRKRAYRVLLDMMRQVETTLLSRNYDGFLKKGKLKGKYAHIQGTGAAAGSRTVTVMWIVIALLVLAGAIAYNAMQ